MIKIIAHGGAGIIPENLKPKYSEGIREATKVGLELLLSGSTALNAVEKTVMVLEENATFNAGRGSVLTIDEKIEMDAMIMDGKSLRIGGVICLENYLHPISIARVILEKEKHILFSGMGADRIAKKHGFQPIPTEDLITDRVRERLRSYFENIKDTINSIDPEKREIYDKYGTVGCVALDENGFLASATSTGGVLGKESGRVGDTPIPGAGTYADDKIAISATGTGEYIIRSMLALRIKNHYDKYHSIFPATIQALNEMSDLVSGKAGVIVLSNSGDFSALHNTQDLCYAYSDNNNKIIDFTMEKNSRIRN
jgi:beta-aspartyl-peptidase (threonine type)